MALIIKTTSEKRLRRHRRIRSILSGTAERPRLSVFRSNRGFRAQLIDDVSGKTIASSMSVTGKHSGKKSAELVGTEIAKKAGALGVKDVVFDRGGFLYTGNIRVLAESARKAGLVF